MAASSQSDESYGGPLRRLLFGLTVLALLGLFLLWRIDSPRVERLRADVTDAVVPKFTWLMAPLNAMSNMASDFESYVRLYEQNQELRRELQQMKAWREAALQLEQENARLLDLNRVRLDPKLTHLTGLVLADSGSPFRQSILLNVGARDGVHDGWATMDGIGLVGRISGVGETTSRVILLSDATSRIPVIIQPSGQRAMLVGDNTIRPLLELIEDRDQVRPGDRVVTSGDGALFPPDLLIGEVAASPDRRLRVRLLADYERLKFLRVIRSQPRAPVSDLGGLVSIAPASEPAAAGSAERIEPEDG
ncbi:MAG: rod shape-determining protein MreC [Pseudomonadota bacterium]